MLGSGAAACVCPPGYCAEFGMSGTSTLEFRTADGNPVKHHGSCEVTHDYEGLLNVVRYEVADGNDLGPVLQ